MQRFLIHNHQMYLFRWGNLLPTLHECIYGRYLTIVYNFFTRGLIISDTLLKFWDIFRGGDLPGSEPLGYTVQSTLKQYYYYIGISVTILIYLKGYYDKFIRSPSIL